MDLRTESIPDLYDIYTNYNKNDRGNRVSRKEEKDNTVIIFSKAKEYYLAWNAIQELPDIREDKVNLIIQKIKNNTYNYPTSEEIADKILGIKK